jgi:hypothetical protein
MDRGGVEDFEVGALDPAERVEVVILACGVDVGTAGAVDGEAKRMVDVAGGDVVVRGEARKDGQARGVGRRPACRSKVG